MRSTLYRSALCLMLTIPAIAMAQEAAPDAAPAPATATATAEAAVNTEAPAATAPASGKAGTPAEGKGRIVFFRPSKFTGAAIGFKVREGDVELGKLRSGKYFAVDVEPGTHEYTVHSEAKDVLTMEVEAGETYYVQGTITMGFMAGRPNLSPSDQTTFEGMADKLKLAE